MAMTARSLLAAALLWAPAVLGQTFSYELYDLQGGARALLAQATVESSATNARMDHAVSGTREWTDKSLPVAGGFEVGLSDFPVADLDGIGLWLKRTATAEQPFIGFSWEWFDRDGGAYKKRRGRGRIALTTEKRNESVYVTRVEFLTDTVFHLNVKPGGKPGETTHEMVIKAGSVLAFDAQPLEPPKRAAMASQPFDVKVVMHLERRTVSVVPRGSFVSADVAFRDCAADSRGLCDAVMDIIAYDPSGKVYGEMRGVELWAGKPPEHAGALSVGQTYMGIRIEPRDPSGTYRVVVLARDRVAGTEARAETQFAVE
jgi:hypothetical protein